MKRQEIIEVLGIMFLALVISVTFLYFNRTCERIDAFNNVYLLDCMTGEIKLAK